MIPQVHERRDHIVAQDGGVGRAAAGRHRRRPRARQAILELENISDVAVYGEANPLLGQIVVAKVVTIEPETAALLKLRIRKAVGKHLAAFKLPTKVLIADV